MTPPSVKASAATSQDRRAIRTVDLVDSIQSQLTDHQAVWEMLDSLAELCARNDQGREPFDGLWEGLRVISRRFSAECAELNEEVDKLHALVDEARR